jgi:hypothetical protein
MSRIGILIVVAGLIGCSREVPPSDLNDLTEMVGCTLSADTALLGGRRSDTGAYWLVRSSQQLALTSDRSLPDSRPAEADIPEGVLTGLLKQHNRSDDVPGSEDVPGRLREWDRPDGLLRIREFQTSAGWYSVIEFSPTPAL